MGTFWIVYLIGVCVTFFVFGYDMRTDKEPRPYLLSSGSHFILVLFTVLTLSLVWPMSAMMMLIFWLMPEKASNPPPTTKMVHP